MRRLLLLLALTSAVILASCGGNGRSTPADGSAGGQVLQSIQVKPTIVSIAQGTTQAFTATGTYSDGTTKDLTLMAQWSCLLPNLATVSNNSPTQGLAKAVAPGTALITASMGSVSNSGMLNIKGGLNVTSLVLIPAAATIGFGNQQQFTATAVFSDNTQQDVTDVSSWSLFPPFITSNSGLAIGNNLGTNSVNAIFAGSGGGSATAMLTVDTSNLTSISLLPSPASIANHTQLEFAAVGAFTDGSTRDVGSAATWSSSNPAVAENGFPGNIVKAKAVGTTTITATVGDLKGSTTLDVTDALLQSIAVFPVDATIAPTTKLNLTAIGVFSDFTTQDLTTQLLWSVLDPSVASVQSTKGIVAGLSAGSTTVTATSSFSLGSIQGSTQLGVTAATLSSMVVTPANPFMPPGGILTFSAMGKFSDRSTQDVSNASLWTSESKNVATSQSPVATGQGLGQSTIAAKLGSVLGSTNLSVASPQQISIALTPATVQIASQTSSQLTAKGTLVDGRTQDLTTTVNWSSSSAKVALVGGHTGIVSGLAPGQATITATLGPNSSTTQVTVTKANLVSITLSPTNPSITLGHSQQLTAMGKFNDGTSQTLLGANWSSSSPTIAAVDGFGLATSTGLGTSTIKATLNGVSGTTSLTVH